MKFFQYFQYYCCSTEYCKTSWFFQTFTLFCHITINKFYSQWESQSYNLFMFKGSLGINSSLKLFITTLVAAFSVCSILQWKMSRSDSFSASPDDEFFCVMLNQLLIECPSNILDVLISLTAWKYIKESYWKNKHFSPVIRGLATHVIVYDRWSTVHGTYNIYTYDSNNILNVSSSLLDCYGNLIAVCLYI